MLVARRKPGWEKNVGINGDNLIPVVANDPFALKLIYLAIFGHHQPAFLGLTPFAARKKPCR